MPSPSPMSCVGLGRIGAIVCFVVCGALALFVLESSFAFGSTVSGILTIGIGMLGAHLGQTLGLMIPITNRRLAILLNVLSLTLPLGIITWLGIGLSGFSLAAIFGLQDTLVAHFREPNTIIHTGLISISASLAIGLLLFLLAQQQRHPLSYLLLAWLTICSLGTIQSWVCGLPGWLGVPLGLLFVSIISSAVWTRWQKDNERLSLQTQEP